MMVTLRLRSCSSKSRPSRRPTARVWKYPGLMKRTLVEGSSTRGRVSCSRADDIDPGFAHQRQGGYQRGVLHAGHGGGLFQHALEERGALGRLGVLGGEQGEVHGEHAIHLKAFVDGHEAHEAGDEEAGGDEQRGAETDLEADQDVAHAQSAAAFGIAAAARFQGFDGGGAQAAQGGQGAEDEAGEQRNGEGEEEHLGVQVDFLQARQIDGRGGEQGAQSPVGEGDAERSAGQREDECFR